MRCHVEPSILSRRPFTYNQEPSHLLLAAKDPALLYALHNVLAPLSPAVPLPNACIFFHSTSLRWDYRYATLQPYELFSLLWKHQEQFQKVFLGDYDEDAVGSYWDAMLQSDWDTCPIRTHPELYEHRNKVMPWFIHSDGGEVYKGSSYTIYNWCSPFAHAVDPRDSRLYILMVEEAIRTTLTEGEITQYLRYQDDVMRSGVHPRLDFHGKPVTGKKIDLIDTKLAGGWRCCFTAWTGDIKEETKVHKLSRNYNCHFFCKKCLGCRHKQSGNAYDFRPNAFWMRNLVSHRTYLLTTPPASQSPYVSLDGWTIYRCREDDLHQVWLGFAKGLRCEILVTSLFVLTDCRDGLRVCVCACACACA